MRHRLLWLVVAAAAALRLALLLTAESHVDGDEAIVGVMARHITTHAARPIFYWGQYYGGGGAIEAWLAQIPFAVFGPTSVSLKLVALALSLATLPAAYFLCLRSFGRSAAVASLLLFATATPLIEWNLKVRGGYAAIPLLWLLVVGLYARIATADAAPRWASPCLGLAAGVAYYNQELIAPLLAVLLAAAVSFDRRAFGRGALLWAGGGFAVGIAPIIYFNLAHDFANVRHLLFLRSAPRPPVWEELARLPSHSLPRFFLARNVDAYAAEVPLRAWAEYAIYAALFACAAVWAVRALRRSRASEPASAASPAAPGARIALLLVAYVLAHLLVFAFSGVAHRSARYLLPLYPALAILSGVAIASSWESPRRGRRAVGAAALAALVGLGLANHLAHIGPSRVVDAVLRPSQNVENRMTAGAAVPEILALLKREKISHVAAAHFLQWRILFESGETVLASSSGFHPDSLILPDVDAAVAAAERVALIFHRDSLQLALFEQGRPWRVGRAARAPARWLGVPRSSLRRSEIDQYVIFTPGEPEGGSAEGGFDADP